MITKKQFTLLFCVLLFAVIAFQAKPVEALPFDNEYTDVQIVADDYSEYFATLSAGDVISGYFETDETSMGLDFFICDAANFTIWDLGGSATGFEVNTNMHTLGFEFEVPYGGIWYIVLSNPSASAVWVDLGIDINSDNTPYYNPVDYDYTEYGDLLEVGDHHDLRIYLYAGTVVDGHFSTFFTSDGIDFFICDESNYDDWQAGYSATGYSTESNMHLATIDSFTVPSSGYWHLVWVNDDIDAITISYGVELDTSGADTGGFTMISGIGLAAGLLLLLILCCVCRSKKKTPTYVPPTQPTGDHYTAPQPTHHPPTIKEREIVRDRVLVICPYCGAKNEQGVLSCYNCDAQL